MPGLDPRLRRALCLALLGACAAHAAPPLPQRNLVVEMRVADDSAEAQRGASVTVGSRVRNDPRGDPRVDARAAVVVQGSTRSQTQDMQQRVLVLNGSRATLRLAQGQPVADTEIWWTPWGPGAAVRSQWVELVDGMDVWPRWPGGGAPVTLQVAAQSAGRTAANWPPAAPTLSLGITTVQAPLGEWVEVARLQSRQTASVAGGGFGAATSARQRSLQMRVSLP
jgi:hypothetical protein